MENSASEQIQQEANSSRKNDNTQIPEESRTSSGNEDQNKQLVNKIETMFEMKFLAPNECRIYKVPYQLREWNEEAYIPKVISIGPYHHDKKKFETMEKHKVRYFKHFMQKAEINLENLVSTIRKMEDSIQCCYVETVHLKSDDFVQMIMFDAAFILELFLKTKLGGWPRDDPMHVEAWLFDMVKRELLLLENQLPFFVIEKLYHLALPSLSNSLSLIQLTFHFFKSLNVHDKAPKVEIQNFGDLLRFFQLPKNPPERKLEIINPKYSATQLHGAGVKFKLASSKCILDINFEKGVLEIPLLEFHDDTEARVRNIMALEQCDTKIDRQITDFYLILDRLINTDKDVALLCDKGIIVNCLGDNNVIRSMINKLNRGIFRGDMNTRHYKLCKDLNKFYEQPWHGWKASLRRKYFSTPCRTASTIAAVVLLVLTFIQTVCSSIQILPTFNGYGARAYKPYALARYFLN